MQQDIYQTQRLRCVAITLIVFCSICFEPFGLLLAIFALVGNSEGYERWETWKTPCLVMYIISLILSIISIVILAIYWTLVSIFSSYFPYGLTLITVFISISIIVVSVRLRFCYSTYNAYNLSYYSQGALMIGGYPQILRHSSSQSYPPPPIPQYQDGYQVK